jgi:hypothetical protein
MSGISTPIFRDEAPNICRVCPSNHFMQPASIICSAAPELLDRILLTPSIATP